MTNGILAIYILVSISQKFWLLLPGYCNADGHHFLVPMETRENPNNLWTKIWIGLAAGLIITHLAVMVYVAGQPNTHPIEPIGTGMWVNMIGGAILIIFVMFRHRMLVEQRTAELVAHVNDHNPQLEPSFPKYLAAPLLLNAALIVIPALTLLPDHEPVSIDPRGNITWGRPTLHLVLLALATLACTWLALLLLLRSKRKTITVAHLCSIPATLHIMFAFTFCIPLFLLTRYMELQHQIPFLFDMSLVFGAFVFELLVVVFGFLSQICQARGLLRSRQLISDLQTKDFDQDVFREGSAPLSVLTIRHRQDLLNRRHPHLKWLILCFLGIFLLIKLLLG
ncbi:hypothetical protein [Acanthopleuribacter pedis]|uniref:Uncharacterized protein n=1 Tax=Acanthopleuribacter pedis TaxID=442870 RepID=A0A8J7QJT2_9BACT|nr:hypothetical protein [Acanthopleuribacter pedis]MBO1319523.1 hypothetical protein [Acanthopleuribacter pedis]